MSVGLLLITHKNIGKSILDAASSVLGHCPLQAFTMSIENGCNPERENEAVIKYLNKLDNEEGILIITDLYGSTPSNIACRHVSKKVKVVSGINLPMLVRILNYPNLDLNQLLTKATSGGIKGITCCEK